MTTVGDTDRWITHKWRHVREKGTKHLSWLVLGVLCPGNRHDQIKTGTDIWRCALIVTLQCCPIDSPDKQKTVYWAYNSLPWLPDLDMTTCYIKSIFNGVLYVVGKGHGPSGRVDCLNYWGGGRQTLPEVNTLEAGRCGTAIWAQRMGPTVGFI